MVERMVTMVEKVVTMVEIVAETSELNMGHPVVEYEHLTTLQQIYDQVTAALRVEATMRALASVRRQGTTRTRCRCKRRHSLREAIQ